MERGEKVHNLNCIDAKYNEIRTFVYSFGKAFTPTQISKANLGFGIKTYKQQNMLLDMKKKQNSPKIPYGTVHIFRNTLLC
jgi:hypothetical protein